MQANILPRKHRSVEEALPSTSSGLLLVLSCNVDITLEEDECWLLLEPERQRKVKHNPREKRHIYTQTHTGSVTFQIISVLGYFSMIVLFSVPGRTTIIWLTGNLCTILTIYFWLGMKGVGLPITQFCMKHWIRLKGVKAISCLSLKGCKNKVDHIGF